VKSISRNPGCLKGSEGANGCGTFCVLRSMALAPEVRRKSKDLMKVRQWLGRRSYRYFCRGWDGIRSEAVAILVKPSRIDNGCQLWLQSFRATLEVSMSL
jgi:hypothetical protein